MNRALDEETDDGGRTLDDGTVVDEAADDEGATRSAAAPPAHLSFTRGMNTRAAVHWVRTLHGEDGVRRLAASLPADVVTDLGGPTLRPGAMHWVPFRSHSLLLEKIDKVFGAGDLELLIVVGRAMAFHDFPFVARPFARLLNPGLFLDMATRIWGLYNSHGSWEISRGTRELQGARFGCPESHPAFCAGTRGWVEGALLFCGAIDAHVVEERCAAKGAPCCSIRVTWREKSDDVRDRRPRPPT